MSTPDRKRRVERFKQPPPPAKNITDDVRVPYQVVKVTKTADRLRLKTDRSDK